MDLDPYVGQIVIAGVSDIVKDEVYKMKALIKTGDFAGKESFVAYRGNPHFTNQDMLVRIDFPRRNLTNLDLEDFLKYKNHSYAAHFISSKILDNFEYGASSDFILYGIWQDRMKGGFDIPNLGKIANFYDPGGMSSALHYSQNMGFVTPYLLVKSKPPKRETIWNRSVRGIGSTLGHYIHQMKQKVGHGNVQLVTIDEHIDFEKIILPEFNHPKLKEMGILGHIKMEPQQ